MIDKYEKVYLIGVDGGLRQVPAYMVNDMQKRGWRFVVNPKRQYYPEYDQTSPNYKKEEDSSMEIEELEVDVL